MTNRKMEAHTKKDLLRAFGVPNHVAEHMADGDIQALYDRVADQHPNAAPHEDLVASAQFWQMQFQRAEYECYQGIAAILQLKVALQRKGDELAHVRGVADRNRSLRKDAEAAVVEACAHMEKVEAERDELRRRLDRKKTVAKLAKAIIAQHQKDPDPEPESLNGDEQAYSGGGSFGWDPRRLFIGIDPAHRKKLRALPSGPWATVKPEETK